MKSQFVFAVMLLLAGCSQEAADSAQASEAGERIACAVGGAAEFSNDCVVEQSGQDGSKVLIVRHPDGAFRRFDVLTDGRGLQVTDGAEGAQIALSGDLLDVTVGKDRYRFPARLEDHAPAP
jgi:hypothetical protein